MNAPLIQHVLLTGGDNAAAVKQQTQLSHNHTYVYLTKRTQTRAAQTVFARALRRIHGDVRHYCSAIWTFIMTIITYLHVTMLVELMSTHT